MQAENTYGDVVRIHTADRRSGWVSDRRGREDHPILKVRLPILASRDGAQFESDEECHQPAAEFDDAKEVRHQGHPDQGVE